MTNCTATFNKTSAWNIHHLVKHKDVKFTCGDCIKTFATPGSFCNHINLHKESKYECPRCNWKFVFKCGLNIHKNLHRRQKIHECFTTNCNKWYKWRQDLLCHIKNHVQDTLFECKICNYSSCEGRLYRCHVLVHTNKTPYKCHQCPTAFKHAMQCYCHEKTCKWAPDNTN